MSSIRPFVTQARVLRLDDSVATAADAVRASSVGSVPVVRNGFLVGLVSARVLAQAIDPDLRNPAGSERVTVAELPLEGVISLPESMAASDALALLRANRMERAPVLNHEGAFIGMISAAGLACSLLGRERPPVVGGMATPFGVHLVGGGVRGGVSDWALVSTGVAMAVLALLSRGCVEGLFSLLSGSSAVVEIQRRVDLTAVASVLEIVLFAVAFRMTGLTGYHAAEHQVVHSLEAGDELTRAAVREKPRVHPRCGTNLMVAVSMMDFFWRSQLFHDAQPLLGMLVTVITWRKVGGWVQQNVTTRRASDVQLDSGIRAAEQLLSRYQSRRGPSPSLFRRIWNTGLLQVVVGWLLVIGLLGLAGQFVPLPEFLQVEL